MSCTPGIHFVIRALFFLLVLYSFIASVRFVAVHRFGIFIPTWVLVIFTVVCMPIVMALRIGLAEIMKRRRATVLGASIVPTVTGKWPGNMDVLIKAMRDWREGYPSDVTGRWMKLLGTTFNVRILWDDVFVTMDPEHVKIILATDFPNYVKGEEFRKMMASVLGTGVFNSDGNMWKFHRSMTRPFFSRDRITHFDIFDLHVEDAIKQMKERFKTGHAVDFQDVISRFTLDSASEFLFGHNVRSLSAGLPYAHNVTVEKSQHSAAGAFAAAFAQAQHVAANRARLGWIWPLFEIFQDKSAEPMKVVNSFLDPILDEAIAKHQLLGTMKEDMMLDGVKDDDTLLDHLVKFTTDRVVLKDEILNILLAGKDTTAATMTFVIYALSTHPAILARLREEVLSKVEPSSKPTYDNIRAMSYLRAVINESLRLFPPVPFNFRKSVRETTLPVGKHSGSKPIYIPAKTNVNYSAFMIHRRTDLWGPDALEFDPDRFLDDRAKKYLIHNPFIFLPFHAGPRICLGQQFAYNQMSYVLIRLLQNFSSISLDPDSQPPETRPPASWAKADGRKGIEKVWPKVHLTMYANGGLWVKMREAKYA